jgi:hypothetical protein
MSTTMIERTISTSAGRIDVALFDVTGTHARWFEIAVRDHRTFPLTETGVWLTTRTYANETAARAGYEQWFALETALAVPE